MPGCGLRTWGIAEGLDARKRRRAWSEGRRTRQIEDPLGRPHGLGCLLVLFREVALDDRKDNCPNHQGGYASAEGGQGQSLPPSLHSLALRRLHRLALRALLLGPFTLDLRSVAPGAPIEDRARESIVKDLVRGLSDVVAGGDWAEDVKVTGGEAVENRINARLGKAAE